jgi:hypothetical protein
MRPSQASHGIAGHTLVLAAERPRDRTKTRPDDREMVDAEHE